jgi:2-methylcitrate dehydratase PrpD
MTVLEKIAERLAARPEEDERVARHVLDAVGVWIAGRGSEEAHELARLRSSQPIAVFGDTVLDRLALRVATTRLSEMDDIHLPSCTTAGAVVIPAALAVAGSLGRPSAAAFAHAVRDGYGLMTLLGTAIQGPVVLRRGIWPTYFLAPVATAAVTARLLGVDAARTANALAIALTMTSGGVADPSGKIPRWLLVGLAARQGAAAGLAAAEGFTGDRRLLDGDWLKRVHGVEVDAAALEAPLPTLAALSMKPHCAAKQTMAGTEAFVELVRKGIAPEEIAAVKAEVLPTFVGMIGHHDAGSRTGRLTGLAYQMAVAVYCPENLCDVNRPPVDDERIGKLMEKVEVTGDATLERHFPQAYGARVEVTTKSGRKEAATVIAAGGDPGRQFSEEEVAGKFHHLADAALDKARADELCGLCLRSTADDGALGELCRMTEEIQAEPLGGR